MQQRCSKYFALRNHSEDSWCVFKRSKFIFLEHGYVAYQIKWNHECSNMVANILLGEIPLHTLGVCSKGQNSTFLDHGYAAYQIKWNHECSNMVANILYLEIPPSWGGV